MKTLVIGGRGFIGSAVKKESSSLGEVYSTCVEDDPKENEIQLDLRDIKNVRDVLTNVKPEFIVNCAGIVTNDDKAKLNELFTRNVLQAVVDTGIKVKRLVILGSAAEYGLVDPSNLPVDEDTPLNATSLYGLSKVRETTFAREFSKKHGLPVVVARLFNPIGANMPPRMLITGIKKQAKQLILGETDHIEVSRLDSERDYIDVKDVAVAIGKLLGKKPEFDVYNIGTNHTTTTRGLVNFVLMAMGIAPSIPVVELSAVKEPSVASKADISRITKEFGWVPVNNPESVIKELSGEDE